MKPAPFSYHAPRRLPEALELLGRPRRRRQGAGRRPEPDPGDELPPGPAGGPGRRQRPRRARLPRRDRRRWAAAGSADAACEAWSATRGWLHARRCSPQRCPASPIRRSATAAPWAAASPTPTRPPSCRRWRWRSTPDCACVGANGERWVAARDFFYGPVRHRPGARGVAGRDRAATASSGQRLGLPRGGAAAWRLRAGRGGGPSAVGRGGADRRGRGWSTCRVGDAPVEATRAAAGLAGAGAHRRGLRGGRGAGRRRGMDPTGDIHASTDFKRHLAAALTRRALAGRPPRGRKEGRDERAGKRCRPRRSTRSR